MRRALRTSMLDAASRLWARLPIGLRSAVRRHLPRPRFRAGVLAVISNREGEVLLLHHRFRGALPWGLPGGWLEPGEDPTAGMCRELSEELGLDVDSSQLTLLEATSRAGVPHIEFYYGVRAIVHDVPECPEFDGHGWFAVTTLPDGMLDEHRLMVARLLK